MQEFSQKERFGMALAGSIIVLSAISILVLIYTGAGTIFYATAIISVILAFYITYSLSRLEEEPMKGKKK